MRAVETRTDIAAPPWRVWRVLTDFAAYPAWNPFLTRVEGRPEPGARLRVRVEPPGRSPLVLMPRVVALKTGRALRWRGRLLFPRGLLDGEHGFELEPLSQGRATPCGTRRASPDCWRHSAGPRARWMRPGAAWRRWTRR